MDETELHLQIEKRLSKVEERMDGMEAWVTKLETLLNGVARSEDVKKLMDAFATMTAAVKGKNTAIIVAIIGGFFGLAGSLFGLLKS